MNLKKFGYGMLGFVSAASLIGLLAVQTADAAQGSGSTSPSTPGMQGQPSSPSDPANPSNPSNPSNPPSSQFPSDQGGMQGRDRSDQGINPGNLPGMTPERQDPSTQRMMKTCPDGKQVPTDQQCSASR